MKQIDHIIKNDIAELTVMLNILALVTEDNPILFAFSSIINGKLNDIVGQIDRCINH